MSHSVVELSCPSRRFRASLAVRGPSVPLCSVSCPSRVFPLSRWCCLPGVCWRLFAESAASRWAVSPPRGGAGALPCSFVSCCCLGPLLFCSRPPLKNLLLWFWRSPALAWSVCCSCSSWVLCAWFVRFPFFCAPCFRLPSSPPSPRGACGVGGAWIRSPPLSVFCFIGVFSAFFFASFFFASGFLPPSSVLFRRLLFPSFVGFLAVRRSGAFWRFAFVFFFWVVLVLRPFLSSVVL